MFGVRYLSGIPVLSEWNGYDEDYKYWPGKPRRHHLCEYVSHIQRWSMSLVSKSSIPYLCQTGCSYCSLTHRAFVLIDVSPASPFNHDHTHASWMEASRRFHWACISELEKVNARVVRYASGGDISRKKTSILPAGDDRWAIEYQQRESTQAWPTRWAPLQVGAVSAEIDFLFLP